LANIQLPNGRIELGESKMYKENEAANFLGLKITTLRDWRVRRVGPPYVKYLNRSVRYPLDGLAAFVEQSRILTAP
jgi:hypothetical protein